MSPLSDENLGLSNQPKKYIVGQSADPQTGDPGNIPPFGTGWSAAAPGALTGDSSGVTASGGWREPQFFKNSDNMVFLEGHAAYAGGSAQTVIFTLPSDYAPDKAVVLYQGGPVVTPDGKVTAPFAAKAGVDVVKLNGFFHAQSAPVPPNDPL